MAVEYHTLLQITIATAQTAGAMLREEFYRPGGPRGQHAHAEIDVQVERYIHAQLLAATPDWNFWGEETGCKRRDSKQPWWVVDPNDGTSDFLRLRRGSAVSIAVVHQGRPVLGVVYSYVAPDDAGDCFAWAEGGGPLLRNGVPIERPVPDFGDEPDDSPYRDPWVVLVSSRADRSSLANARCVAPARYRAMPSIAYRLALVAAGEGVAAVSLGGPKAHDLAAGHALLRANGGELITGNGQPLVYPDSMEIPAADYFGGGPRCIQRLARRPWNRVLMPETMMGTPFTLQTLSQLRPVCDRPALQAAQGCLMGQAVGDSLGQLVEFRDVNEIAQRYPDGGPRDLQDGGTWALLAGQPTDDTEMAIILARTLVRDQRWDPLLALQAYRYWLSSKPFDVGMTTRAGIQGSPNLHSQANGSLMRCSPLGIFSAGNSDWAVQLGRQDSAITHPHPACGDSVAAFLIAIASAIGAANAADRTPEAIYQRTLDESQRLSLWPTVIAALQAARSAAPADYQSSMGHVLLALQNAFWQLLHAPSFEAALIDTVRRGGDTDTNAAITGALLGAVHGLPAIPARWQRAVLSCRPLPPIRPPLYERVRPMEFWPVDLLELAEMLLAISRQPCPSR
ncbi:inositol monophosphatase family protein [Tuwongella immobilis]|uniref:Uncharacterized protein n=1 Tax=Tuwongella immobilis TaxID=692036 RepID=A0A6C2YHU0_9BACT|nr:inositol monophosphatase family protein [Tuwongella immobilis]VIP00703.1 adp-ribosylation crystallin j1 : Uncharacterized protein OS=Sorangium cellulosum So0157-2 GN=SCE1572_21450 PE=4 SV=1: Inositol_P: ADP_ribosyl_GH [Tuwongella immobilis]VTR96824.1 adp-ribosylation crystallin j1 : Uncharacterized protein OS=Sorangium cellulosum So0157-2 GN=SCE1572_21450 PE=4 SV=1: Inositol_P: ADP_ribosyl_GH [Tuwongella immobilis]